MTEQYVNKNFIPTLHIVFNTFGLVCICIYVCSHKCNMS